jgi:CheY-like chemotaxis protein
MATVLYVDDEAAIRRLVRRWFERRGVSVITAESATVDVWLGRETGIDLYAWIVEHKPALRDRVVFITGDILPGVAEGTGVQALGRAVIAKPFELEDLDVYVRQWSNGGGGPRGAEAGAGARR